MPSYPGAIATLSNPAGGDALNNVTTPHALQHDNANDEIEAIETELGLLPKGSFGSVLLRLNDVDTKISARVLSSTLGAASGVATLDAGSQVVQNIDAAKVTTGTLGAARIPNLDAAKITTGQFATGRIPNLDAAIITTGAFAAARIPSLDASKITTGVFSLAQLPGTINGVVTVVADNTARDAITPKVNGMLAFTTGLKQLFVWQASVTTWFQVGGPADQVDATSWMGANYTSFDGGAVYTPPIAWVNQATKMVRLQAYVKRQTSNAATAVTHAGLLVVPSQYRPFGGDNVNAAATVNCGGTENTVRCTQVGSTGSVDIVLPATQVFNIGQFAFIDMDWRMA